jgi:hypothetical protein
MGPSLWVKGIHLMSDGSGFSPGLGSRVGEVVKG